MGFSCNKQERKYKKIRKRMQNKTLLSLINIKNNFIRFYCSVSRFKLVYKNNIKQLMNSIAGTPMKM